MKKNFILAFRHILRYKEYSLLNIVGLALGMACAVLIILWVNNEVGTNKFHKNADNIYELRVKGKFANGIEIWDNLPSPLAQAITSEIPEVKAVVRIPSEDESIFRLGEKTTNEKGIYADSCFFNVFSFNILSGDKATALNNPNSVVITQKLAQKYFGNENPIGKTITIRNYKEEPYIITGICENREDASSLKFDYVLPYRKYLEFTKNWINRWGNYSLYLYILTDPKIKIADINQKITTILHKNAEWSKKQEMIVFSQPFKDIYLYSDYGTSEKNPTGLILYVHICSFVAIFIVLLASLNYVNLSTALSVKRAKEIGIKKVFGSNRLKLIGQFTLEAMLLTFIGFFLSLVFVELSLPYFNIITNKHLQLNFNNLSQIAWMLMVPLFTGLFAGTFPAIYMSSFNPIHVLKRIAVSTGKKVSLRQVLVVFQFIITIVFIIFSVTVARQVSYINSKSLGLDKDNVLFFEEGLEMKKHLSAFKQELLKMRIKS